MFHDEDFDMAAEWHFFATSHGKNACDEVGATIEQILSAQDLFEFTS